MGFTNVLVFAILVACWHSRPTKGQSIFHSFQFNREPEDKVVVRGSPVILDCSAETGPRLPPPVIRWKKDGEFIEFPDFNDRRRLLSNGSLYFNSFQPTRSSRLDEGLYQCVATVEKIGTLVSRTATLRIAALAKFDSEPKNLTLFLGQTAVFECEVTAKPPATVKWMKDDQPLVLDHRMKIMPSGMLEISDVRMADRAKYNCNVSNEDASRMSRGGDLRINLDLTKSNVATAPQFLVTPRNTKVFGSGSIVTLDCAANGVPKPFITWLKDGETIDLNLFDTRFSKVGQGSLQIKEVTVDDQGTYQCRAENSEDSVDAAAILEVLVAPRFLRRPQNVVLVEKGDIEFECEVYSVPQSAIQWYKNGDLIIESEYFQIVRGSNLKILGLVETDSGIYQCVATNLVGNIQSSAQLKVTKKDGFSEDKNFNPGRPSTETAPSTKSPLPNLVFQNTPAAPTDVATAIVSRRFITITWGRPINADDTNINGYSVFYKRQDSNRERVVNSTRGNLEEVNIQGLQPGTTYAIRVVGFNDHGMGESSDTVLVKTEIGLDIPGPVTKLDAKATSSDSILITWGLPVHIAGSITGYKLYYRQTDFDTETRNVMVSGLQYHLTDLYEFTEYTFWLSAFSANGEGILSEEVTARTYSDIPADPPQNVTLESASSKSIIVRWEPPPPESQNGIITGYKIRWRRDKAKGESEVFTTDGSRRLYAITGLKNGKEYQIKISALTVNGSGPTTPWLSERTLDSDLDETIVPEPPSSLKAKAYDKEIVISWTPPRDNTILVRGYTIGWGKGIPDELTKLVDDKQRQFSIANLKPNSEYVISLRAYNDVGDGRPIYETIRTKEEEDAPEPATPLMPPVGLNAIVLSSSTVVLTWVDSSLPRNQLIPDNRYYVVRYNLASPKPRQQYRNSTDLNVMVDDLKPNTEYEFTVKIVRGKRQSPWSLVAVNKTLESAPSSPPRDLTVMPTSSNNDQSASAMLSWRPPKTPNGKVNGYIIQYTTDKKADERDWQVEAVIGDVNSRTIHNLLPETKYYFTMKARNNKGYGPQGPLITFVTSRGLVIEPTISNSGESISPLVMYAALGTCAGFIIILVVLAIILLKCRTTNVLVVENLDHRVAERKNYLKGETGSTREKLNPPPPDLWIGHDQLELKGLDEDETLDTTLARSTSPDYRSASSMDRTRGYPIHPYSGTESEVSFSLLGPGKRRQIHVPSPLNTSSSSTRLLAGFNGPAIKIAAINGKPRVQRYLSKESVASSSIVTGSASNSSTYIRSQYNLNPPPPASNCSMPMEMSITSPDDLPPPGYDPSLTLTAPSDGPPSTIGDLGETESQIHLHNGNGSVSISSSSVAGHPMHTIHMLGVPAEPPKVPSNYLSSAMSTSSGDSSSNHAPSSLVNFNNRRQSNSSSSGSHPTLKSFSTMPANPINANLQIMGPKSFGRHTHQTSPLKRPLGLTALASGNSLSEDSSCASSSSASGPTSSSQHTSQALSDHGFHSGHLPTIADVRSPDVLHPKHGPCDCLALPHSISTEELNAEMKNLEGLMRDLNSISNHSTAHYHH